MKLSSKWFVADFETTGIKFYKENGYTKVWLWAVCDDKSNIVKYGNDINSFIERVKLNSGATIYFHNLKFDGSFILNYLFENNYTRKEKITIKDKNSFSTLIGEMGEFYKIRVVFTSGKNITFVDSLKIIPLKVKEIAKAFNLPIQKEIIDYDNYVINDETLSYIYNDVKIVAMALKFFKDKGFNKLTIGSNSYNTFINSIKNSNELFPILDDDFLIDYRKAYRGGRCQVNPKYANKVLTNVRRYDLNSMYPYIMAYKYLPYGKPIKCDIPNTYKFELYKVSIMFTLKKGHLPSLLKKGSLYDIIGDTYYENSDGIELLYISSIDLEILKRHYDIKYLKYEEIYGFHTADFIFRDFILKYYELKNNSTGGLKLVYKLILNSLYGKFGSKLYSKHKIPYIDEERLKYKSSELERMKEYYLPLAIAVVSYAHLIIDNAISYNIDKFVYCDTDSVHTLDTLPTHMVNNKEIGKFKLEGIESKSKYVRQKCYVYCQDEKYNITCSGMTESIKDYLGNKYKDEIFNIFKEGLIVNEDSEDITINDLKLRPKQVKGGCVLVPTPFSIK